MNKLFLLTVGLFALGTATGITMMYMLDEDTSRREAETRETPTQPNETDFNPMARAFKVTKFTGTERIHQLEVQLEALSARIEQLEQEGISAAAQETKQTRAVANKPAATADAPLRMTSTALTTENLVNAGISFDLAADIVRRQNEIDLKTLELRDRAVREGYLGTSRYSNELNDLREQDVSLRAEIGGDAYDRYLYSTGQRNRVNITSVMSDSPAEQAGMQTGDVILNYGDSQMFNWSELQDATTLGERGDYVNVTVLRDGQLLNLWLPRGPLGVRLGSIRVKP